MAEIVTNCKFGNRAEPPPHHMISLKYKRPALKIVSGAVVDMPTPARISSMWNFGSLLGLCLITQIVTGLFLAMHYSNDVIIAFERVRHISRDVNYG